MKRHVPFHSNAVWPPWGMVAIFAVIYLAFGYGPWIVERSAGHTTAEISSMPEILTLRAFLAGLAATVFALYRLWRFHPICSLGYTLWLKSSPWTPRRPLPLGPLHPVWQDAAVVGVLAALVRWHAKGDWTMPFIAFGLSYLIGMTALLMITRTWLSCLLLGFLWPVAALPKIGDLTRAGVFAVLVLVMWYGYRQSLRAFPWWRKDRWRPAKSALQAQIRMDGFTQSPVSQAPNLGWPFQWIGPKLPGASISLATSLGLSALLGWWIYCAMVGAEGEPVPELLLFLGVTGGFVRLLIYYVGVCTPFNVWGRLSSGRLIIPGFDVVFVTPLIAAALSIAGGIVIRHAGAWERPAMAIFVFLIAFTLMSGGPTMRRWILTGHHRLRPPSRLVSNSQLLRPI